MPSAMTPLTLSVFGEAADYSSQVSHSFFKTTGELSQFYVTVFQYSTDSSNFDHNQKYRDFIRHSTAGQTVTPMISTGLISRPCRYIFISL
jgi:hypothetical protein